MSKLSEAPDHPLGDRDTLEAMFFSLLEKVANVSLQRFLRFMLYDCEPRANRFFSAPGARSNERGHHSFRGGLAYHTITVAELASDICDHYESIGVSVDRDIVIAGVLLHDIGKIHCYEWNGEEYTHTKYGKLFHHIPVGYNLFLREVALFNEESFKLNRKYCVNGDIIDAIAHIILSHHGRLAWSSPVTPQTIEAYIVHSVEMMDAYVDKFNRGHDVRSIYD